MTPETATFEFAREPGLVAPPKARLAAARAVDAVNREPFPFTHNLHELDLFGMDSLRALAERTARSPWDFFVAQGAPQPGSPFYQVPHGGHAPHEAIDRLGEASLRVLLKRPELHDPRFEALKHRLFEQILDLDPALRRERILRLDSAVFITSSGTTTPFHYDAEIAFFFQVAGEKRYHVYSPAAVSEPELERYFGRGARNVGQIDLAIRDPQLEHFYRLHAGDGFHQPHHAPHWVETGLGRSVSYSLVFETATTRRQDRARAFNHYLRKSGLRPGPVAKSAGRDTLKAAAMRLGLPARRRWNRLLALIRRCQDPSLYDV